MTTRMFRGASPKSFKRLIGVRMVSWEYYQLTPLPLDRSDTGPSNNTKYVKYITNGEFYMNLSPINGLFMTRRLQIMIGLKYNQKTRKNLTNWIENSFRYAISRVSRWLKSEHTNYLSLNSKHQCWTNIEDHV